jgi:signal transduction histidine kinase/ligand-binding sensor domain-containing protein
MWFGTDNGLARFDGRRVQNFSLGESGSNRVLALKTTPNGSGLWVGTRSGAFEYVDNKFEPIPKTENLGITAISFDEEGLLGTDNGFVLHFRNAGPGPYSPEKLNAEPLRGVDGSPLAITSLNQSGDRLLAATADQGVFSIRDARVGELKTSPRPVSVNSLALSDDGTLWLGADAPRSASGVFRLDANARATRVAAQTGNVLSLETNESGLWAGTERFGLFHVIESKLKKNYTFENTSGGLRSNTVYALFTDREGVLWIGTNRGVSLFDRLGASQQNVSDIPNSNFIRTIVSAEMLGEVFYAGSNRGLFRSTEDGKWIAVPGLRNKSVYAVKTRNGSAPIVGTADGLYDLGGKKLLDGDVRSLAEFNSRYYAAVFGRGLFDVTTEKPQLVVPNETITSIAARPDRLLIGTNGAGLYSFDGKTAKLEIAPDVLRSGIIWKIDAAEEQDTIWIAGQHGVFLIEQGKTEQIVTADDVRDIWVNFDEVWATTTTRGLIHARRDERFGWLSNSIGFEQGLPSEKAFAIAPIEYGFLIGTNRGIVTYEPGEIEPKLIPTRVLSQRVHDLAELASTIQLEYPQNSLLVEVAGQSSRTFPEEFQYGFVLTNSSGKILDRRLSNDTQYAAADLDPGEYTIEAIAFNRDLVASDPMTVRFSIDKAPFPWTATALGVLLFIALVGLIWAIVEHRRIAERNRELAAARFDLANEAERERRRIARDLHDQTLADLRNLMIRSDKLAGDRGEFRAEIEAVSTEVRRICEDLSPSVLENVGLVAALEFLLGRTGANRRFSADESVEDRIGFPLNVQLQVYRIAQEVLTNIETHSNAGSVEMRVETLDDGEFLLTIADDGRPFRPVRTDGTGRGIANIRSRANLINAKVSWRESPGGGNVFLLKIAGPGTHR